ncbi:MAG TPA: oligoendopeptidase F, partial [Lachnospiraceae bacterium]|nr:oligoendopeptidase F [Lachnospiraceae bacterium]
MGAMNGLKKREEVEQEYKWAIEDLFQNDDDWKIEYEKVKKLAEQLKTYQGKLSESADTLLAFLRLSDECGQLFERVFVYANQRSHENTANSFYQNLADQAGSLDVAVESAVSFAQPEIIAIPDEKLNQFLASDNGIKQYTRLIKEITRKKDHTLSAEMEALIADAGEMASSPQNIYSMFNNADVKFPDIIGEDGQKVAVTHGRFISYMESKNRDVRKAAFESVYKTYASMKNSISAMFSANVKAAMFRAKAKKYDSTLSMFLDNSNIPTEVYTNLIDTVHANLPKMHRYVSLRKKLLGVDELHMYDVYTPLIGDVDMKYSFEQAKEIVLEGLAPLGEKYQDILREGYSNSWIDIYENEGKRSGAYSWGAYGTHPYVLLNYQDNLDNVFTLAHEMGHAIHSYQSDEAQPFTYAGYKIFVAEVASTCNEALLIQHLLGKIEDKKERAYLVNHFLDSFKGTLFRQTMFAEFEMLTHRKAESGEALTPEVLCGIYHDLNM